MNHVNNVIFTRCQLTIPSIHLLLCLTTKLNRSQLKCIQCISQRSLNTFTFSYLAHENLVDNCSEIIIYNNSRYSCCTLGIACDEITAVRNLSKQLYAAGDFFSRNSRVDIDFRGFWSPVLINPSFGSFRHLLFYLKSSSPSLFKRGGRNLKNKQHLLPGSPINN